MTGSEALIALVEGDELIDSKGIKRRIKNRIFQFSNGKTDIWEAASDSINSILRRDTFILYKSKFKSHKYFQCWAIRKDNSNWFGPILIQEETDIFMIRGWHGEEKSMLKQFHILDRNGRLIVRKKDEYENL